MADERARREIAQAVARTLHGEARRNELLLAYGRVVATAVIASMDTFSWLQPQLAMGRDSVPAWMPLASWSAVAGALVVMIVLRTGFYRDGLRFALPAVDAVMITVGFLGTRMGLTAPFFVEIGGPATLAIACSLLAFSGSLRLTRPAAGFTAGVAIIAFLVGSWGLARPTPNVGIQVGLLVAIGLISVWITSIVGRAVESEVGRAMLARFLPRQVVEDAHADPMSLLREPRSVDATVLVTDLRGFTSYAEHLSPEEVMGFLNQVQGAFARVVREHGGTVDKFMGDGMLAVFGAPEPVADDARRAICAAEAILVALDRINADRAVEGHPPVALGIGIHTGQLVVGCLGSGLRLEFTIVGDTVNTASRLEALTKEKGTPVLVSAATVELATRDEAPRTPSAFEAALPRLVPVGEVTVRGRRRPLELYTLAADRVTRP